MGHEVRGVAGRRAQRGGQAHLGHQEAVPATHRRQGLVRVPQTDPGPAQGGLQQVHGGQVRLGGVQETPRVNPVGAARVDQLRLALAVDAEILDTGPGWQGRFAQLVTVEVNGSVGGLCQGDVDASRGACLVDIHPGPGQVG